MHVLVRLLDIHEIRELRDAFQALDKGKKGTLTY
jgi:hypothetical protein